MYNTGNAQSGVYSNDARIGVEEVRRFDAVLDHVLSVQGSVEMRLQAMLERVRGSVPVTGGTDAAKPQTLSTMNSLEAASVRGERIEKLVSELAEFI